MNNIEMIFSMLSSALISFATTYAIKIVAAIVVLVVGFKITKTVVKAMKKSKALSHMDDGVRTFLTSFTSIALKVFVVISVIAILGFPMTSVITVLGSAGVAIGLALQGSLSNIAGGIIVLIFKPYNVGDFITSNGISGTVEEIGIFYTKIITADNRRIVVPNAAISNQTIENANAKSTRRVDFEFTCGYDDNLETVKKILTDIATTHPLTLDIPAPEVHLSKYGDSAVSFVVRVWCNTPDYWTVNFDITEKVKQEFDKNNISIPYPQMDIHIKEK